MPPSITTTDVEVRNCLKVVMGALALAGITGMYLRQVKQAGVLGLIGYLLFSATTSSSCRRRSSAGLRPAVDRPHRAGFVDDVLAVAPAVTRPATSA